MIKILYAIAYILIGGRLNDILLWCNGSTPDSGSGNYCSSQ